MSLRTRMYNCVFGIFVFGMAALSFWGQDAHGLAGLFAVLFVIFCAVGVVTASALVRSSRGKH